MGNLVNFLLRLVYALVLGITRLIAFLTHTSHLFTARFAKPHEVDPLQSDTWMKETGLLLGVSHFNHVLSVRPTKEMRELGNILVVARSRGGKGILAVPQLESWPHSFVANDIKWELSGLIAEYLRQNGYKVHFIDPTGLGHQFDPFNGRHTERELYALAKQLLYEPHEKDPIFIQRATKMLTQLFLAARTENQAAGFEKYRLLPYVGQLVNRPLNRVAEHLQAVSPELATKFLSTAFHPEKDYDEKKFLASAWESLTSRLYPILSDELLRCFDGSDFTANEILTSDQPLAIFLRWPEAELLALAPVVRLVWESLIHDLITTYDRQPGRTAEEKGCHPVLLLIDEAGRSAIPQLYDHASTVVGRGISLWIAIQSLAQLDAVYGRDNAQTLRDNMDTQLFYRPADMHTAKYLQERLGDVSAYARSETLQNGHETSEGRVERPIPLLSSQDIGLLGDTDVIAFHRNMRPMRLKRMDWRNYPILKARRTLPLPKLPILPPLTQLELHSLKTSASDDLMNPDERYMNH
jgi:type IV secretion system protein VirD4